MKLIEYGNNTLIDFYKINGLEFTKEHNYFGKNIKSLAIIENNKVIGAISVSIYKNKSFIEALAISKEYRHKGYGKILLEKALQALHIPIYTISKVDDFYLKNGFTYSEEDLIGKECKSCPEYNTTCYPKVMVCKERVKDNYEY